MRYLIADTETTGLSFLNGDRVIEVALVEYVDGKPTGKSFYSLINPERAIPADATQIHGIKDDDVRDKPVFRAVAADFVEYVRGARIIAHNAPFDVGMLNNELELAGRQERVEDLVVEVIDSLRIARGIYPKAKNDLDSLMARLNVGSSTRSGGHNARVDCALLGEVFFKMTEGVDLSLMNLSQVAPRAPISPVSRPASLPRVQVPAAELAAHEATLDSMEASGAAPVARRAKMG
jgi:DNA polymerase-3 subunit epsilon